VEGKSIGLGYSFQPGIRSIQRTDGAEQAIIQFSKGQIANFKVPKQVFFVDELPRNAMGKVQKNVLRERYGSG
jgi:malonyl-CoA/methylmalonyl-CoA synthetase